MNDFLNDFEIDINLNSLWNEVLAVLQVVSSISITWTSKDGTVHSIPYVHLFFGAWLVYELFDVFFGFNWLGKEDARDDV